MTEKSLEKFSTTAVLTAIAMSIPNPALAEDGAKINLSPDTPAEQLVEWRGADSPNLIDSRIDKTRRNIHVTTTTNAPVALHAACPPSDLHPKWKLDLGKKGTDRGYPAEVHDRDTVRTGPNGTWTLDTTAPSRPNTTLKTTLTCYHDADDDNVRDEGEDSHSLTAHIRSQGSDSGSAIGGESSFFTYSGEGSESGDDSTSTNESPVWHARGAVADTIPMSGVGDTNNLGVLAAIGVDPVHGGGSRNFEIDLIYRSGRVPGEVTDKAGKKHVVDGRTHCGFIGGGLTPELGTELVRGRVAAAIGVCAAEALETDYGRVDGKTSVGVGRGDAGIEVGGRNIGVMGGVDGVVGADSSARFWGPYIGVYGRW